MNFSNRDQSIEHDALNLVHLLAINRSSDRPNFEGLGATAHGHILIDKEDGSIPLIFCVQAIGDAPSKEISWAPSQRASGCGRSTLGSRRQT